MKIKEEMHDYKYIEIITVDCESAFIHENCRMGIIVDQGIVVQGKEYDYFYPMNKIIRMCTRND